MAANNRPRKSPYPGFSDEQWEIVTQAAELLQMKPTVLVRAAMAAFLLENTTFQLPGTIY